MSEIYRYTVVANIVRQSIRVQDVYKRQVSYKFSVTNAQGGTSTLSDFSSAKSVTWTPTAVSYTHLDVYKRQG